MPFRTRPRLPENYELTRILEKAHEAPKFYVLPKKQKMSYSRGRMTPPSSGSRRAKVSLPKLHFLDEEQP